MTRSSLKLLHVLAPVVAVILCLALTAWLSFRGAMQLERGLSLVQDQIELGDLVARLDSDFQLCVSKAKNYAILRDALNRERTRAFFAQASASADRLLARAPEADRPAVRGIVESLAVTGIRIEELLHAGAKGRPGAEQLYRAHLQDITIPFDQATSAYQARLRERSLALRAEVEQRFRLARGSIMASLGVVLGSLCFGLLALLGVGRQLRQALQGLTGPSERAS